MRIWKFNIKNIHEALCLDEIETNIFAGWEDYFAKRMNLYIIIMFMKNENKTKMKLKKKTGCKSWEGRKFLMKNPHG